MGMQMLARGHPVPSLNSDPQHLDHGCYFNMGVALRNTKISRIQVVSFLLGIRPGGQDNEDDRKHERDTSQG